VPVPQTAPPAGESGRIDRAGYEALAAELEADFSKQVLPFWFPRIVDPRGGYVQHIKSDGTLDDDGRRSLVVQARSTWLAAEVALRYPALRDEYRRHATHGVEFLQQSMWDREKGGLYWELDARRRPTTAEKHAYGIAFGIYAAAVAARATESPGARDFARQTFRWLDEHAHDAAHGGYHEALGRDGHPIQGPSAGHESDSIGTRYGRKSMNTHLHLLEAFTELYRAVPDELIRKRLEEVFLLLRDRITAPAGFFHLYFAPDWTPIPTVDSYGHDVEGAYLLLEAAEVLGLSSDERTLSVAERLIDHALAHGWDEAHGGFFGEGEPDGKVTDSKKVWWAQAEGLNGLLALHVLRGDKTDRYIRAFRAQWQFIQAHLSDRQHGDWWESVTAQGELVDPKKDKGHAWKAGYHNGRALLVSAARLRELAARAPAPSR
jgi:cellobiose epimerase